ncbi:MAG: hypothetical protein Q7J32_14090 [Sphingomonadaceae bacterium]|jgi:hypothetical protein|nr:hypothetical protein [Sphingomonadaceae bacterium]
MSRRNPEHTITETRDWAEVVLAAGVSVSFVILALLGDIAGAVLLTALGWLRQ